MHKFNIFEFIPIKLEWKSIDQLLIHAPRRNSLTIHSCRNLHEFISVIWNVYVDMSTKYTLWNQIHRNQFFGGQKKNIMKNHEFQESQKVPPPTHLTSWYHFCTVPNRFMALLKANVSHLQNSTLTDTRAQYRASLFILYYIKITHM